MKLEDHVRWAIYNYPTLFRDRDYTKSRLLVLNQLFLVIGNGYEWCPDGYLVDAFDPKPRILEELPAGFFDKQLYTFDVQHDQFNRLESDLQNRFLYLIDRSRRTGSPNWLESGVVVEADEEEAKRLCAEYGKARFARSSPSFVLEAANRHEFSPYPICEYSALTEILNGKTNSPHIENFDLELQPDWLAGCVDVAQAALDYYRDDQRCAENSHHPNQAFPRMKQHLEAAAKEGREEKYRQTFNITKGESVERHCEGSWHEFRANQIGTLEEFLDKFGGL